MNKKNIAILISALVIIVGGFLVWKSNQKVEVGQQGNQEQNQQTENQQGEIDTSEWKTYKDEKYGFEIKYPKNWEIKDSDTNAFGGEWLSVIIESNPNAVMQINRRELKTGYLEWIRNQINPLIGEGVKMEIIGDNLMNNDIYAWHVISSNDIHTFKTHNYYISNKKTIVVIHFNEVYDKSIYSSYLYDFEAMVHSINFFD